jgi:hypothetical protein
MPRMGPNMQASSGHEQTRAGVWRRRVHAAQAPRMSSQADNGGRKACTPYARQDVRVSRFSHVELGCNRCNRPSGPLPRIRKREVSLTTTLITKLLTNPLAQSQSRADSGDRSPASGPSTSQVDCRWHGNHAAQNDGDATRITGDLSLSLSK